jgi:hypothetical protein
MIMAERAATSVAPVRMHGATTASFAERPVINSGSAPVREIPEAQKGQRQLSHGGQDAVDGVDTMFRPASKLCKTK